MILCNKYCNPCCDFCAYALHGDLEHDGTSGPIGCILHLDKEHQDEALSCGFCDDFHCFRAKDATMLKTKNEFLRLE